MNNYDDMNQKSNMIIYTTEDGLTKIETTFDEDTVWLSIDQMAELFQRDKSTISRHIKNVFSEGELQRESVVANFATTAADGKTYQVDYYNLDVIISVGYRVKSKRGTQFRIWATNILKEYMRKGFALDDERLKNLGGGGYFKELLERIRDIRASEKVFYRQVLEIYATSIDYDPKAEISIRFFKKVQNKIHYAIHGQTAAEVIYTRADAEKEFMGLTTFAGNQPTLKEAIVAKNYLDEKELRAMGQLVSGYLDFAERQAEREQAITMQDWSATEVSAISRQLTKQPASTENTKPVPSVKLSAIIWIPSSCWSRKQIKSRLRRRRYDEKRKGKSLYLYSRVHCHAD